MPAADELAQYELAAREHPEDAKTRYLLGAELAQVRQYERAVSEMSAALVLQPDLHTARFQLGLLYLTLGQVQQASAVWAPLEQLAPDSYLTLFKRGMEALVRDEFLRCVELLSAGIAANPTNTALNRDMSLVIGKARDAMGRNAAQTDTGASHEERSVRTDFSLYDQ